VSRPVFITEEPAKSGSPSRLAGARERALTAKVAMFSAACCAFGIAMVLVRVSHPASGTGSTATAATPSSEPGAGLSGDERFGDDDSRFGDGFAPGGIAPGGGGIPQARTGSS
jgi:hypothetical protein